MDIQKMTATFGKLQNDSLSLQPGLNVIYAPNESGKSTWSHFLRVMLYGISTKDRGSMADKNRFAPWQGNAMQGSIDFNLDGTDYTVTRTTLKANSPMGEFHCHYQGTGNDVDGLDGNTFGQTILGVPREVFERSAFIGQAAISVSQDSELERRIIALMTTGDETVSYSKTNECLKKKLNQHQHNKTGDIPKTELEINELQTSLARLKSLKEQADAATEQVNRYKDKQEELEKEQDKARAYEKKKLIDKYQDLSRKESEAKRALDYAKTASGKLPGKEELAALEVLLRSEKMQQDSLRDARARAEESVSVATEKKAAWDESKRKQKRLTTWFVVLLCVLALLLGAGIGLYFLAPISPLYCLIPLGLMLGDAVAVFLVARKRKQVGGNFEEEATKALEQAQQDAALVASLNSQVEANKEEIIQSISPYVENCDTIDGAAVTIGQIRQNMLALEQAESAYQQAALQVEVIKEQLPEHMEEYAGAQAPQMTLDEVNAYLRHNTDSLQKAQSQLDVLFGQIRALGNEEEITVQIKNRQSKLKILNQEYAALSMAMDALDKANTEISNRFSPELGEKAAEIFSEITGSRYDKVLLNRDFNVSAQASGDVGMHEISLLSQGTADQLYFAIRLAICHMVLPEENRIPIVLDDTFIYFDDDRLATALDYLLKESEDRQILLFTCQKREGDYLKNKKGVSYQELA